jgi:hypothetical protein
MRSTVQLRLSPYAETFVQLCSTALIGNPRRAMHRQKPIVYCRGFSINATDFPPGEALSENTAAFSEIIGADALANGLKVGARLEPLATGAAPSEQGAAAPVSRQGRATALRRHGGGVDPTRGIVAVLACRTFLSNTAAEAWTTAASRYATGRCHRRRPGWRDVMVGAATRGTTHRPHVHCSHR